MFIVQRKRVWPIGIFDGYDWAWKTIAIFDSERDAMKAKRLVGKRWAETHYRVRDVEGKMLPL